MRDSLIFNPINLKRYNQHFQSIFSVLGKYYEAVENAQIGELKSVFHEYWVMRDTDTPNESFLNVEDKKTFIERVEKHGPYTDYAADRFFSNIGYAYDQLAFIRVNKDPSNNATGFFLFNLHNQWVITDKIWVNPSHAPLKEFSFKESNAEVDSLIKSYFQAIAKRDKKQLDQLLHKDWNVKQLDPSGEIMIQSKQDLLDHLPLDNHALEFGKFVTKEIYQNKLAIVRIDQPPIASISYLVMFKINDKWKLAFERKALSK